MTLPSMFLQRPISHRALHGPGKPENSRAAVRAALSEGYAIEIDVQTSSDGRAMVFHDYDLRRLTAVSGAIAQRTVQELQSISLNGADEGIPTLSEILKLIDGSVPLLIEIKDQDGAMGDDVGSLEAAVIHDLAAYAGPVALMSFNPHSVAVCQRLAPHIPRGLVTDPFTAEDWPTVPAAQRASLVEMPNLEQVEASFISHNWRDLGSPWVAAASNAGCDVLCWTIRSPEEEATARQIAKNVTFEGYSA